MNIGELNKGLQSLAFIRADEAPVTKGILTEIKTYIEGDRELDLTMGWPGALSPNERRQRDADYELVIGLLETFEESGE